jgi:hypothetical protein
VLVERSSRLARHLLDLHESGRRMRITETIVHLKEDEAGFGQEAIRELL